MDVTFVCRKQEGCSDISDNSEEVVLVDPDCEMVSSSANKHKNTSGGKSKKRHKIKHKKKIVKDGNKKPEKILVIKETSGPKQTVQVVENNSSLESSSDEEHYEEPVVEAGGKNLLEILELEMRARAIRALLQNSNNPEEDESENLDHPNQNTTNQVDKQTKSSQENKKSLGEKITPVRNFRKKKRKNDDVIVITPKLVTIDLTDENDPNYLRNKTVTEPPNKSPKIDCNNEESGDLSEAKTVPESDSCINEQSVTSESVPQSYVPKENDVQNNSESQQKADQSKNSWTQRWLESEEVKKVVSTSKICGNIRKRIKSAKLAKKNQENSHKMSTEIQGSVNEYQLLSKTSKVADSNVGDGNSSEASTFLPSGEGDQEIVGKDSTLPSVEQVQDITSTKNETSSDKKIICTEKDITQTEINDTKSKSSTHHNNILSENFETNLLHVAKTDSLETDQSVEMNSKLEGSSHTVNLLSEVKQSNPDDVSIKIAIDDVQSEKDVNTVTAAKISESINTCKYILLPDTESKENSLEIKELDSEVESSIKALHQNQSQDSGTEHDISHSKPILCEPNLHLEDNHDRNTITTQDKVKNTSVYMSDLAIAEKRMSSCISPTQENEPETLEINITDEDREIDGIDDKLEIEDSNITNKQNIEIIEIN
ncbi:regulation of apoptotic process [Homalodisca vitripennis]|nr:regulation of apoptotic process [Homalodisca vitripennis]